MTNYAARISLWKIKVKKCARDKKPCYDITSPVHHSRRSCIQLRNFTFCLHLMPRLSALREWFIPSLMAFDNWIENGESARNITPYLVSCWPLALAFSAPTFLSKSNQAFWMRCVPDWCAKSERRRVKTQWLSAAVAHNDVVESDLLAWGRGGKKPLLMTSIWS